MTVETTTSSVSYPAPGTTLVFPFNFLVYEEAELFVTLYDTIQLIDLSVLNQSQYSIVGLGEGGGGSVNLVTAITPTTPNPTGLRIDRIVPLIQPLELSNEAGFFPDTLMTQLDEMVMQTQQVSGLAFRALVVPVGETPLPLNLAGMVDGQVLGQIGGKIVPVANSAADAQVFAGESQASADQALISQNAAASSAAFATNQASLASAQVPLATAQAALATTQAGIATSAANLALTTGTTGNPYPNAAATNVPQGVSAYSLTSGGTGGTNGTNILATFSGGTLTTNPTIRFDIVGGIVGNVRLVSPGLYIGAGTPTMPTVTFPGAAGSPAISLTAGVLVPLGGTYWAASADSQSIQLWSNTAGSPAPVNFPNGTQVSITGGVLRYQFETRDITLAGNLVFVGASSAIRTILPASNIGPQIAALQASAAQLSIYQFEVRDVTLAGYVVHVGAGSAIRAIVGSSASATTALAELNALAANTASPATRVAAVVTPDGALTSNIIGKDRLRRAHNKLTRLDPAINNETIIANFALAGDSYTMTSSIYSERLTNKLQAAYGAAGPGYISFGFSETGASKPFSIGGSQPPAYAVNGAVLSTYPIQFTGSPTGFYFTSGFPDLAGLMLAASGDGAQITFPASHPVISAQILFIATSGAAIQYSTNGGSTWTTMAMDGTIGTAVSGSYYRAPIPIPSSAGGTLTVKWVSGTFILGGILPLATKGVCVHKIAATGSSSIQWATALASVWEANLALLTPDVFQYLDGTNDQGASALPAATFSANVQTIINRVMSAVPSVDFLLATPAENGRGLSPPISGYAQAARALTLTNFIAYRDMQELFGKSTNPSEYDYGGTLPMLNSDHTHPSNQVGGPQIMAALYGVYNPY